MSYGGERQVAIPYATEDLACRVAELHNKGINETEGVLTEFKVISALYAYRWFTDSSVQKKHEERNPVFELSAISRLATLVLSQEEPLGVKYPGSEILGSSGQAFLGIDSSHPLAEIFTVGMCPIDRDGFLIPDPSDEDIGGYIAPIEDALWLLNYNTALLLGELLPSLMRDFAVYEDRMTPDMRVKLCANLVNLTGKYYELQMRTIENWLIRYNFPKEHIEFLLTKCRDKLVTKFGVDVLGWSDPQADDVLIDLLKILPFKVEFYGIPTNDKPGVIKGAETCLKGLE